MRVLTLSHVDAAWIKQRPHFVAEALSEQGHEVTFAYARAYRRDNLVASSMRCRTRPLLLVPNRLRRSRALRSFDAVAQRVAAVVLTILHRPDVVWLCSPRLSQAAFGVKRLRGAKIVYDYMDRNGSFDDADPSVIAAEHRLFERADLVTCSSATLRDDVTRRAPQQTSRLMRNALADPARWELQRGRAGSIKGGLTLGYAGTISSWFDFALLHEALDQNPGWSARLWGPVDVIVSPHDRVRVEGVMSHADLPEALHQCDVLIMPFVLTPLIEAVDPVKAYEYVATGRGVVLPRYEETKHFEPFADRFTPGDVASFIEAVQAAAARNVPQDVSRFVKANTWNARVDELRLPWETGA